MKEIKAFVRPERLSDIVLDLNNSGFLSLTIFEGEGTGHFVDPNKEWPSLRHPYSHDKVAKIEIVVPDHKVKNVIQIIHDEGNTRSSGDGLIYITEVSDVIRVKDLKREGK